MSRFNERLKTSVHSGFTLVEMIVIAPIVILLIGAFIALIVNLTGEVMSSRGANSVTYEVQEALNRIEDDIKLSTTYLATNTIDVVPNSQGYTSTPSATGGVTPFTNIDRTAATPTPGSYQSIILNALVTDGSPMLNDTGVIYLANKPSTCDNYDEYSKNTPMTMNIIYFVDSDNTLWRRVLMPLNYDSPSTYCGSKAPWQLPTCSIAFTSSTFCKSSDERILTDISPDDFNFSYYASASSTTADVTASNESVTNNATRNTALQSTPTLGVSLTVHKSIAGRDITRSGTLRATRLDTNATTIGVVSEPTSAPGVPVISGNVSDGHNVTFTWPRVAGAASYDIDYCIIPATVTYSSTWCNNQSAWVSGATNLDNNSRSFVVTQGAHTDRVEARVLARNSFGPSTYGTTLVEIPLWAPLLLKGNWTDYSSTFNSAAYTRTKSGMIIIKGMVKNPTTGLNWDTVGSLPADYAPTGRLIFGSMQSSNATARVDVNPTEDGVNVLFNMNSTAQGWLSLDSVQYLAANAGYTRTAPSLLAGYSNYGGVYSPVTRTQTSSGRVVIEGLATGGTRTNGTDIFTLPASYAPPLYLHIPSEAAGFSHIGVVSTAPAVEAKGDGAAGYYSMNLNYMPSSASLTWYNIPLSASWVNYGSIYSTAQCAVDSDGMVQLKGLVRNGTATAGTVIGTLPASCGYPKGRILLANASNALIGRVDVYVDGKIVINAGSATWFSLDGITYMPGG